MEAWFSLVVVTVILKNMAFNPNVKCCGSNLSTAIACFLEALRYLQLLDTVIPIHWSLCSFLAFVFVQPLLVA